MSFPAIRPIDDGIPQLSTPVAMGGYRLTEECPPHDTLPVVSVITVTYNRLQLVERTIRSILAQTYKDYELIVIDGGSSDGTLKLLHDLSAKIAYWVSGPDGGIGDAMNKGLQVARGQWIIFLHSDDYFLGSDCLRSVSNVLAKSLEDIVAFRLYGEDASGRRWPRSNHPWSWRINLKTSLLHQATFCRRELFVRIGGFDQKIPVAMDYDWFLRAYRSGAQARLLGHMVSVMSNGGVSARMDRVSLSHRLGDERFIHYRYASSAMRPFYWIYWLIYPLYVSIRTRVWVRPVARAVDRHVG
jgi:glycosyltransferase involved in cell wall biosynthesis